MNIINPKILKMFSSNMYYQPHKQSDSRIPARWLNITIVDFSMNGLITGGKINVNITTHLNTVQN